LPEAGAPVANYVSATRSGNLLFLAGHLPRRADGSLVVGRLGEDLGVEEGYAAARLAAIALIGTMKSELGDLDRVTRILKVTGMVNATPDFTRHSQVINGCSDLMVEVFGERGRHARSASGYSSLPLGAAVEIELIVEVAGYGRPSRLAGITRVGQGWRACRRGNARRQPRRGRRARRCARR